MPLRSLFFVLTILVSNEIVGQSDSNFFKDWHFVASYYSNNLWNPGLQIGAEKILSEKVKALTSGRNKRLYYKQYVFKGDLGFFYDNPSYTAIHNTYSLNYRGVRNKGKFRNLGVGAGVYRTIYPETYGVTDAGEIERIRGAGRWYLAPSVNIGTGRLWKRKSSIPWDLKVHVVLLLNYNIAFVPLLNIEYAYPFGYESKEQDLETLEN